MRSLVLPVAIALAASLAACDTTDTGSSRSGGGLFGSSTAPSPATESRAVQRACDPRNVTSDQRASVLHQDRPGGTDCPDAVTTPRR